METMETSTASLPPRDEMVRAMLLNNDGITGPEATFNKEVRKLWDDYDAAP